MTDSPARRTYRSSIKRGQARPAILAAAARLFARRGFAATSIDDIAREAGVARPTVFAAAGSKPAIFRAVLEAAVAGDEPVAPVPELGWMRQLLAIDDARTLLRAFAHQTRVVGERISDLYWAAERAAADDDAVREVWLVIEGGRLGTGAAIAAHLDTLGPLREDDRAAVTLTLTTIASPASWRALVRDAGWSPDRFEEWAGDALIRLLLPEATS